MGINIMFVMWGVFLAAIDLVTGSFVRFPFFFLVPIAFASWYRGRRIGIGLSILLPLFRLLYPAGFGNSAYGQAVVVADAGVMILVFAAFAELIHRVSAAHRFRDQVLESLPIGVWVADRWGIFRRANPAARELWDADATGESIHGAGVLLRKKGQETLLDPFDWALPQAVEHGNRTLGELLEVTRADGTRRVVSSSAVPIRMEQGRIRGALLFQQDVTEAKRLEDEREVIVRSLEEERRKAGVQGLDRGTPGDQGVDVPGPGGSSTFP